MVDTVKTVESHPTGVRRTVRNLCPQTRRCPRLLPHPLAQMAPLQIMAGPARPLRQPLRPRTLRGRLVLQCHGGGRWIHARVKGNSEETPGAEIGTDSRANAELDRGGDGVHGPRVVYGVRAEGSIMSRAVISSGW